MTARTGWRLFGVGLVVGVAAGCSDQPRAITVAKPLEEERVEKPAELPKGPAPSASDPAAAKVVTDALAAHTGGSPALLDRLKTFRLTRSGLWTATQPPTQLTWEMRGVWPDKFRVDLKDGQNAIARVGDTAWMAGPASGFRKQVLTGNDLRGPVADGTYEWLGVLTPLADPGAVFVPAAERKVNGRPSVGVVLNSKSTPSAVVHFDKETKLLVQFTYEGFESGKPVVKEVTVLGNRPVNGVTLPERLAIRWDGQLAVEWNVRNVEFPVKLPANVFEEP